MSTAGRGLLLSWLLAAVLSFGSTAVPLTILYTNDLHLRTERLASIEDGVVRCRGGAENVLVIDGGDAWHDFRQPQASVSGSDAMVQWMNRVGYDAMALGNHELYWGPRKIDSLSKELACPLLCANLQSTVEGAVSFDPYVIVRLGPLSILLIGLITDQYLPYAEYPWLRFEDPGLAARRVVDEVGYDADLVIAVGHLGADAARRIACVVPEIDVFVTGHSHEPLIEPIVQGTTAIVQADPFGVSVGRLDLDVDKQTGKVVDLQNRLLPTQVSNRPKPGGLSRLVMTAGVVLGLAVLWLL